jgi:hypothetical protein
LSISQILAVSYPAVANEMNKPMNQFAESAFLRELEAQGGIKRIGMGPTIEHTLDYQRNPGTTFLATDLESTSLAKTDVLTAASYTPGQCSVPIVWSKGDDAQNPSENQKVALVKSLLENAFTSHDDLIEENLFGTSNDGFLGLQNIVPDSGQGSPGGINAGTETWWRNYVGTYLSNGTDIEAQLTTAWNTAAKGSGGAAPTLLVSGSAAQALYEGALQVFQRFIDTKEADGGFKKLAFKTSRYVFSQYGGTRIYGLNPKFYRLNVSKDAYREKGETIEIPNANGYVCKLYSMLQATTNNKSRLFLIHQ